MTTPDPLIDAYIRRIGYDGPLDASLATLRALMPAHTAAIPFENIGSFSGEPPKLDLGSLRAKLIDAGRGGYCFEQNALLHAVLTSLGFTATPLAGRVVWMQPPERPPSARSHMLLLVDTEDGPHVADVGFGGHVMTAPLRLEPGLVQETPTGPQRIVENDGLYAVEVQLPTGWQATYRFTLDPYLPVDFEPLNWFIATHDSSIFTANLMLERVTPQVRHNLFNDAYTIRRKGEPPQSRRIADQQDFADVLTGAIGLPADLPYASLFDRLPKGAEGPVFRTPASA